MNNTNLAELVKAIKALRADSYSTKKELTNIIKLVEAVEAQKGDDGYTPIKGVDYFTDAELEEIKKTIRPIKGVDYSDGKDGENGINGSTPVKGIDYLTDQEVKAIKEELRPVKGVDYTDGVDGKNGADGVNGKDGVDGKTEIVKKELADGDYQRIARGLEKLKAKDKLSVSALKDFKKEVLEVVGSMSWWRNGGGGTGQGGESVWGQITGTLSDQTDLQTALNAKQDTLVSGTNIKTVNSQSLLGSGNLVVGGTVLAGANIEVDGDTVSAPKSEHFTEPTSSYEGMSAGVLRIRYPYVYPNLEAVGIGEFVTISGEDDAAVLAALAPVDPNGTWAVLAKSFDSGNTELDLSVAGVTVFAEVADTAGNGELDYSVKQRVLTMKDEVNVTYDKKLQIGGIFDNFQDIANATIGFATYNQALVTNQATNDIEWSNYVLPSIQSLPTTGTTPNSATLLTIGTDIAVRIEVIASAKDTPTTNSVVSIKQSIVAINIGGTLTVEDEGPIEFLSSTALNNCDGFFDVSGTDLIYTVTGVTGVDLAWSIEYSYNLL